MSFSALFSSLPVSLTDRLGSCALHFLWQGAAIAAGLQLLLLVCRRGTAELRHALCGLALLLMAAAPVITWQRLPVPVGKVKTVVLPEAVVVDASMALTDLAALQNLEAEKAAGFLPLLPLRAGEEPFSEDQRLVPKTDLQPEASADAGWQRWLGGIWLGGAALMGVWRLGGLWGTFRLIHKAERAAGELLEQVARMARQCGLKRVPGVRITRRLISPAVAGVLRPVLLLPASALAGLSPRELDFVLAHEFAHIRRQDFLLGLLQSLAETLLFFHPAVWWVSRRMSFEREQACDDAAMRVTGNRRAGASALARLAELQLQHTTAMAPAAGGGQILARVRRLLEPARAPQPQRGQVFVLLPALLTAAAVPLLMLTQRAESQSPAPPVPSPDVEAPASKLDNRTDPADRTDPANPSPGEPGGNPAPGPSPAPAPAPAASADSASPAASAPFSEKATVPAIRGSITDRNGVVLAESAIKDLTGTGRTGTAEIRQYPLGASASHVLGYVKLVSGGGNPLYEQSRKKEIEMRTQAAKFKASLESLSRLSGDQLIEGAVSAGVEDDTIKQFASQWKKDQVEYERLTHAGLGQDHPKVLALAERIRKEKEILLTAAENYKAALATNIKNIEAALKSVEGLSGKNTTSRQAADEAAADKSWKADSALYSAIRQRELEQRTVVGRNAETLAELSKLSGIPLIDRALSDGEADEATKELASKWRADRVEYGVKANTGFDSGHPEMVALSEAIRKEEESLLQWVGNYKASLKDKIQAIMEATKFLAVESRKMEEKVRSSGGLTGAAGIEKLLDDSLRAAPAADGKAQPAVALTLDARIQRICENALRDAKVGRGAAVVLDVNNGDILAMASVPDFDPNRLIPFVPQTDWKSLNADRTTPLANRAFSGMPPGSTFKLVTAIAAGGSRAWDRKFECTGSVSYGERSFKCWTVTRQLDPHGVLDLPGALRNSCNCWFYQAGNAAGIDAIAEAAEKLGVGALSDCGLDAGQNSSFMPTPEWWTHQNRGPWTEAKTANVAIGQGEVLATPLQMAGVAAAVAGDGKVWHQNLVSKRLVNGEWQSPAPELRHDLIAEGTPAEDLAAIRKGMEETVNAETNATGKPAKSSLIHIAGKTGTAQKWRTAPDADGITRDGTQIIDNHTWFIGFAPFEKPRYAFAIVVGNGKSGGVVCAPIAKRIMESVELMNRGKLTVDLSPLAVAKGNFNSVESVEYRNPLPEP
ncbi:MAG: penicillin-binding transpeptidase domain-containing protein [Verrucomicrobiota bacterium]